MTQDSRVELHNGATPHVVNAIFDFKLENDVQDFFEHFTKVLQVFSTLRDALREILQHRPEIE